MTTTTTAPNSACALEGARKQVTVLFSGVKGSMERAAAAKFRDRGEGVIDGAA